ncbi:unnamed protein product [Laminaria digitata]
MLLALARRNGGGGGGRSVVFSAWPLVVVLTAMLALSYVAPASAFVAPLSPPSSTRNAGSGTRSTKDAARLAPLYGIKRKVTFEMEENFSGKVVEPAGPTTSMFGSDANALFDVIEKNKKKAAAAAAEAASADGADAEEGEEEEEREEGDSGDASGESEDKA